MFLQSYVDFYLSGTGAVTMTQNTFAYNSQMHHQSDSTVSTK